METKEERIEELTHREVQRRHEHSFREHLHLHQPGKFIQNAVHNPGRVREEVKKEFGNKGFNENGTIKVDYLKQSIHHAKEVGNVSLERSEILALRLKKEHQG